MTASSRGPAARRSKACSSALFARCGGSIARIQAAPCSSLATAASRASSPRTTSASSPSSTRRRRRTPRSPSSSSMIKVGISSASSRVITWTRAASGCSRLPRMATTKDLAARIRDVPDFPKPGILFKDITTMLKDADSFRGSIDGLIERIGKRKVDVVVGMESRGFIFGAPIAYKLGAGFVPVRKLGKLPADVVSVEYDLEYGSATLEMHKDA